MPPTQRIGLRSHGCRLIEIRPVHHFDRAVAQPVADALPGASRIRPRIPVRRAKAHFRIAGFRRRRRSMRAPRAAPVRTSRGRRREHVGFESSEKRIEISPVDAFRGELRFAVGERRDRAVAERRDEREDGERDQKLDQREAGARRLIIARGVWPRNPVSRRENVVQVPRRRRRRSRSCETPGSACAKRSRARRSSHPPARPRHCARLARATAIRAAPAARRFWATQSASVRCFSSVAASADCATARMPAVSATARIARARRVSRLA